MFQKRSRSFRGRLSKGQTIVGLLIILFSNLLYADKITSCNDGDTCKTQQGKKTIKIRLWGIDAPESGQEGAEASRQFLEKLVKNKNVSLKCNGVNQGRHVCSLFLGSLDIQKEMVHSGWALDYPQYSFKKYDTDQRDAMKAQRGLWKIKNLISPYCYRYTGTKKCNENKLYQP